MLQHLEECERSARIANGLSPHETEDHTAQLFNLVKLMKENQNIKLVQNKNQIMVILDSSDPSTKNNRPQKMPSPKSTPAP